MDESASMGTEEKGVESVAVETVLYAYGTVGTAAVTLAMMNGTPSP